MPAGNHWSKESESGESGEFICLTFALFSPTVLVEKFWTVRRCAMPLTKRQKEVLDYLVAFETKHGYAIIENFFLPLGQGQKEVLDYLVAFETKHGYEIIENFF